METVIVGHSEVTLGDGVDIAEILSSHDPQGRVVITQQGAETFARDVAKSSSAPMIVLPDGEAAKTLRVAESCYRQLHELGVDRDGMIIGVGGGTVTDLAGFVASTYLRGVEAVFVPTTLLGAVDAAIGGKNAVSVGAKNDVGTFWEPSRVIIDLRMLRRLPDDLLTDGLAEIVKVGLIGDVDLVETLEREGRSADLAYLVRAAIEVKRRFVAGDLRDRGLREMLNYGHTLGHAYEAAAGMGHGPAVALGMAAAGEIASVVTEFGSQRRQEELLAFLGLPLHRRVPVEETLVLLRRDKKRRGGRIRMVLLEEIGRPWVGEVDERVVRDIGVRYTLSADRRSSHDLNE